MAYIDELVELDLPDMVVRLMHHLPAASDVSAGEWRSVLELVTSRVASEDRRVVAQNWKVVQQAYDAVLAAARVCGEIDAREEVLRQVNLLVVLASNADSIVDANELSSRVKRLALGHTPMSLDEAQLKAPDWRSLSKDEIRDLRYLKNLFGPLGSLVGSGVESQDSRTVERWLALLPSLP
jgi:hypothetical protein